MWLNCVLNKKWCSEEKNVTALQTWTPTSANSSKVRRTLSFNFWHSGLKSKDENWQQILYVQHLIFRNSMNQPLFCWNCMTFYGWQTLWQKGEHWGPISQCWKLPNPTRGLDKILGWGSRRLWGGLRGPNSCSFRRPGWGLLQSSLGLNPAAYQGLSTMDQGLKGSPNLDFSFKDNIKTSRPWRLACA